MKHYPIRTTILNDYSDIINLYFKDIRKYKLLTSEEKENINKRLRNGDDSARKELILKNLRIIVSIAKQYQGKGVPLEDLISVGNLGLIEASKRYNPDMDVEFISYAVWWIRDAILKEILNTSKLIKIPVEKINTLNKINKLVIDFEQKNFRIPSINEISELLNIDVDIINDLLLNCYNIFIPEYINNPEEEINSLFDSLYVDDGNVEIEQEQQSNSKSILNKLKKALNPIEYDIIIKTFGFNGYEVSIDVLSEQHNISKERVRQIKNKAIFKLRKCFEF